MYFICDSCQGVEFYRKNLYVAKMLASFDVKLQKFYVVCASNLRVWIYIWSWRNFLSNFSYVLTAHLKIFWVFQWIYRVWISVAAKTKEKLSVRSFNSQFNIIDGCHCSRRMVDAHFANSKMKYSLKSYIRNHGSLLLQ